MKPFALNALRPLSEIKERSSRLHTRLSETDYSRAYVFTSQAADEWPGDWVGRAILAQTMQEWALKKPSPNLPGLLEELPLHYNSLGYLGPIYQGNACEQQLSGHGWLLRGLCAYYSYSKDARYLEMARNIVYKLFLPIRDLYAVYPIDPSERKETGDMSGTTQGTLGNWLVSSDTGCAFIPIDGVSDVYKLTGDEKIGVLLKIKAQTHATLTAARGIFRFYTVKCDLFYLKAVRNIFDLYTKHGMTVNFENQNWFDRPEWTEPCAVIDSFMLAMQLFMETTETSYADWAQKILYNGLYHEQRTTGGFGCNSCGIDGIIRTHCFEASWCCTMRGGEGLAKVLEYAYLAGRDGLTVAYPVSSELDLSIDGNSVHLTQTTDYPYEDDVTFEADGLTDSPLLIRVYSPEENDYLILTLSKDSPKATVSLPRKLHLADAGHQKALFLGHLLMAQNLNIKGQADDQYSFETIKQADPCHVYAGDVLLEPLGKLYQGGREEQEKAAMKVLF